MAIIKNIQTCTFPLLIWSCYLATGSSLFAQAHNGEIYKQLIDQHIQARGTKVAEVQGLLLPELSTSWSLDSSSQTQVQLYPPSVSYQVLDGPQYQRSLQLTIKETMAEAESIFSYQQVDTLSAQAFKTIWKHSPVPLRGEDPRKSSQIGKPLVLIGSSILLIVSLFYLRSQ